MDEKYGRKSKKRKNLLGHSVATIHFEKEHKGFLKWFGYARIRSTVENLKNARICRVIAWRQSIVKQNLKNFSSGLCTDKKEERKKILKTQEFVL